MATHYINAVLLSSMARILPEIDPVEAPIQSLSCLANEPLSFQVAYKLISNQVLTVGTYVQIESDLPISLYAVGYLPVLQAHDLLNDDSYRPGLFGDILFPKKTNPRIKEVRYPWESVYMEEDTTRLIARTDSWQGIWLTVNEGGKRQKARRYPIKLTFCSMKDRSPLAEITLTVDVIGARLPKQTLKYTNWFHCDCLCDTYGVAPFSERFWELFSNYVRIASLNGMNTLLTPAFTPPLDTPVGDERMTVQLVDVTVTDGKYSFDFSKLSHFIDVAMQNGIEYFEHSHFFTQWGALHAPKVMATVDGKYKRIFGWDTVAWGKKYKAFLHAYIGALLAFLKARGLDKKFIYHISDEPSDAHHADYRRAKSALGDLLDGYTVCDALKHYKFYEDGTVTTPVVVTRYIKDFYGKAKNLWAYYTGSCAYGGNPNRKLNTTGERNRMCGVQLYMYDIKGFLHWGYNYWYGTLSQSMMDPRTDPGAFMGGNPGSAFLVYPAANGECLQSIRQKVFYEAVNDMRALQALEKQIGKRATHRFVLEFFGEVSFEKHLGSPERLLAFRAALNDEIAKHL